MSTWEERLQTPEIQDALKFINATPKCLSVLYDLDLLPEQTMKEPLLFIRTLAFVRLFQRVAELEAWIVDEVDPMNLSEPRRSEWHTLHEKLHPENYK